MISQEGLGKGSWFDSDISPTGSAGEDIVVTEEDSNTVVYVPNGYLFDTSFFSGSDSWEIPNMLYCPENIFGNNISMLDVNFLNPNTYTSVVESGRGTDSAEKKTKSIADSLKNTVSSWYKAFRNIAIVALLSILVYLGIRTLLTSSAEDKAKYKESIKNWLVALCLVFLMHFIMSAAIMIVNQINKLFIEVNNGVYVNYEGTTFRTNFTGVLRFLAQANEASDAWAYTVMYLVLIFYTISFTIQYLKRVLYIAFYTMISPLVAITYPIDKIGDGKAQAFNMWFKEYIMTMVLQPIHLIIYTMIISSSLTLSIENPIYALVAIGFLIPAEQFIKKLFGVQSTADGGFGSFASGALTMNALNKMKPIGPGGRKNAPGKSGGNNSEGKKQDDSEESSNIRQANNPELSSFRNANDKQENNQEENENPRLNSQNESNDPMLDVYEEKYGTEDYDPIVRDAMAREGNSDENGMEYSDDEYEQILRDSGYSEEEIAAEMADRNSSNDNAESDNANEEKDEPEEQENVDAIPEKDSDIDEDRQREIERVYDAKRRDITMPGGTRGKKMLGGLLKGGLAVGKTALRTTSQVAGAAVGGTIGAAAGIATGKGLSGALQGAGVGLAAGKSVGTSAFNVGGRVINGVRGTVGSVVKTDMSDRRALKNIENNREMELLKASGNTEAAAKLARDNFKPTKEQKAKYKEIADQYSMKTGQKATWKDIKDKCYDYEANGVTDSSKIVKGLALENKYSDKKDIHDNMVDVMKMTNKYDDSYIYDKKKRETFENKLDSIPGLTEQNKENFKELFYEVNDVEYKKASQENNVKKSKNNKDIERNNKDIEKNNKDIERNNKDVSKYEDETITFSRKFR